MSHKVDIFIMTALPIEYHAVRENLIELNEVHHQRGNIYETGNYNSLKVAISRQVEAGNVNCVLETERAINFFSPEVILFIGVAGGIKNKDVKLNDVIVANGVYFYESGKEDDSGFKTRPKIHKSSFSLVKLADSIARTKKWGNRVHIKPMIAGEKILASRKQSLYKLIQSNYNDAAAIEMEGYGFLEAVYQNEGIKAIVIRGISDLLSDKNEVNNDNYQESASKFAAEFSFELIEKYRLLHNNKKLIQNEKKTTAADNHIILPDLLSPGYSKNDFIKIYRMFVGKGDAEYLYLLSNKAITSVVDGDFKTKIEIGKELIKFEDNTFLTAEGFYFCAEGLRSLMDFVVSPEQKKDLLNKALKNYTIASSIIPNDPRPVRGIGRILQLKGNYHEAIYKFLYAKGLCYQGIYSSRENQRLDLEHEMIRISRHLVHCILEYKENDKINNPWNKERKRLELEGLLIQSENIHDEYLGKIKSSNAWFAIERFMGLTFLAQANAKLGQSEKARFWLRHALDSRQSLIDFSQQITAPEKANLLWWTNAARNEIINYDHHSCKGINRLRDALIRGNTDTIANIILELIQPIHPLGKQ